MNAQEHMKAQQDYDLLCQLAMSVCESANSSVMEIETLINKSKSDSVFSKMLGQSDYINPKMRENLQVLKLKFHAFALYQKAISSFHIADEKVSGYGEVVAIITKAKEMVDLFIKNKHKCSINAIVDNAEKTQEVITKK